MRKSLTAPPNKAAILRGVPEAVEKDKKDCNMKNQRGEFYCKKKKKKKKKMKKK